MILKCWSLEPAHPQLHAPVTPTSQHSTWGFNGLLTLSTAISEPLPDRPTGLNSEMAAPSPRTLRPETWDTSLFIISSDFRIYPESNHFSPPSWSLPLSPSSHPYPMLSVPPTAARGVCKYLSHLVPPLPRTQMAATSFRGEAQFLTMVHKALPALPCSLTALTSSLLSLCSFHSSLTGLLVILQTHQVWSHLRTFALVPSA